MSILVWGTWQPEWLKGDKVNFDGVNKLIVVHPGVTSLDIRTEVYMDWVDWMSTRGNAKYLPAMRYTGFDVIGAGTYTGDTYFLINGWKLVVDLATVRVTGILYSDDYASAYYTPSMALQYPATVSSLANSIAVPAAITAEQLWAYANRALTTPAPPTAVENADAIWAHAFARKILTIAKFLGLK